MAVTDNNNTDGIMKFSKWNLVPLLIAMLALFCVAQVDSRNLAGKEQKHPPRAHPFSSSQSFIME